MGSPLLLIALAKKNDPREWLIGNCILRWKRPRGARPQERMVAPPESQVVATAIGIGAFLLPPRINEVKYFSNAGAMIERGIIFFWLISVCSPLLSSNDQSGALRPLAECLMRMVRWGELGARVHLHVANWKRPDTAGFQGNATIFVSDQSYAPINRWEVEVDSYTLRVKRSVEELSLELDRLSSGGLSWTVDTRFVVLLEKRDLVFEASLVLWDYNAINFVLLVDAGRGGVDIFTAFPFDPANVCKSHPLRIASLGSCRRGGNFFPQKIPLKFPNCPLTIASAPVAPYLISTLSSPALPYEDGIEFRLLYLVADNVGLRPVWLPPETDLRHHGKLVGTDWTDALGKLYGGQAHLALGGYTHMANRSSAFKLSIPYNYNSYAFYAPSAKLRNSMDVFDSSFFLPTTAVYLVVSFCFWASSGYRHPIASLLNVLRLGLGQAVGRTPKGVGLKILIIFWTFYQMHVTTTYLSMLTTNLRRGVQVANYSRLQDLKDNRLRTCMKSLLLEDRTTYDPLVESIFENAFLCEEIEAAAMRLHKFSNFSILCDEDVMDLIRTRHDLRVAKLDQVFFMRHNCFVFRRGSPYADRFDSLIYRVFEAGIAQKIIADVQVIYTKRNGTEDGKADKTDSIDLYCNVLLWGWGCSTLGLCLEYLAMFTCRRLRKHARAERENDELRQRPFLL
ncbi:hypothetical protein AAG570_011664 [Ranatra chinensis]|uniref:Ionotropic glutamate receptor L-glutamate and glycine-binding domain-containing protein n=1 Tax=Ranatra chinensis TaxID=642074 RepID=A0ABD0YGT7_9HEMI